MPDEEGEVSALVCDNGSGMVKVRGMEGGGGQTGEELLEGWLADGCPPDASPALTLTRRSARSSPRRLASPATTRRVPSFPPSVVAPAPGE